MAWRENVELGRLLRGMRPVLDPGRFVFTTVPGPVPGGLTPVVTVAESEGLTLVVPRHEADAAGLGYDYVASRITLQVHSALDAVGLTAAVASALAQAGISCNVVAGYHHDHLFVPAGRAAEAIGVLEHLAAPSIPSAPAPAQTATAAPAQTAAPAPAQPGGPRPGPDRRGPSPGPPRPSPGLSPGPGS